jgi:hypothetical protein
MLASANGTCGTLRGGALAGFVQHANAHDVAERAPKMVFTERDRAIQAFFSDRAYEPLCEALVCQCLTHPSPHALVK